MKRLAITLTLVIGGCLVTTTDGDPTGSGELGERFRCIGRAYCDDVITDVQEDFCAPPNSGRELSHQLRARYESDGCVMLGRLECTGVGVLDGDGVLRPCLIGDQP